MTVLEQLTRGFELPKMIKVVQRFSRPVLEDIPGEINHQLKEGGFLNEIKKGDRVAVTAGSRGIANIPLITGEVIRILKEAGARPFIIPAMGSHGGATAAGQVEVVHSTGIREDTVGAPIRSTMDVVKLGTTDSGLPVCLDRYAAEEADAIVVINRIKPHTTFRGPYESGLAKMIAVGLGKQEGAELGHQIGPEDLSSRIEELARFTLKKAKIAFGVGILENAYDETCRIEILPGSRIMEREPELLREARDLMPGILFPGYDVLVVDEVGKNISGTGMDPNIIGRYTTDTIPDENRVQRIAVLGLTKETHGNANGIGLADVCSRRAFDDIVFQQTYPNCLTTRITLSAKIPMVMDNDEQAIRAAIKTCFNIDAGRVQLIRIKNTLHLEEIYISESLIPQARSNPHIEVPDAAAKPMAFDVDGNITTF